MDSRLLKLNLLQFFNKDSKTWETNPHYIDSRKKIENSNVVNDCAERAVNMTIDFVDAAHIISRSLDQIGKYNQIFEEICLSRNSKM